MRRRSGGGAAPAEACGVWLDTAELKRGPARPPSAKLKAPTRIPGRRHSLGLLPQPGTRQSTIPTFFSPHTDGKDKENSRPTPCTPNKDWEDSGAPLAACPVKILALPQLGGAWEEPPGAEQGSWKTPQHPLELQGESQSQDKTSCGAGEDSWCCQGSEHGGIITARNKSWLFPGGTASGSRNTQPWGRVSSGLGFAGTENTNPGPGAAPRGVCCSAQSPVRAQPLREQGQVLGGACRQLWGQDSQGNRVTVPRARGSSRQQLELGSELLFTQDSQGNRDIGPRARGSPRQQLEPGSEPLFTQDSQGNRDIGPRGSPRQQLELGSELLFTQDSQGNRDTVPRARGSPRQQLELGSEPLFTQDSQGNRDTIPRARGSPRQQLELGSEPLFTQDSQGNRDTGPRARGSPRQQLELGSEPLFTQDSQGNRVIKHC